MLPAPATQIGIASTNTALMTFARVAPGGPDSEHRQDELHKIQKDLENSSSITTFMSQARAPAYLQNKTWPHM